MAKYGKGLKSQEEIIEVATNLFGEDGYFGTSIQKIANAMGLTQSAVFHHFRTKIDLFEGCITNAVMTNQQHVASLIKVEDDAKTRLKKHFKGNLDWCYAFPYQANLISLLFYLATHDPKMREILFKIMDVGEKRLCEVLHAGVREKTFVISGNTELFGKILHDQLFGHLLKVVSFGIEEGRARRELLEKLDMTLEGCS